MNTTQPQRDDRVPGAVEVAIATDSCAASALCQSVAPRLFSVPDDADTAVVTEALVTDAKLIALAQEAADACPTQAIILSRRG